MTVGADEATQHRVDLADAGVEREHARLEHLTSAERQQLAGQAGGPLARVADLLDVSPDRIVGAELLQDQIAVAQDAGEQVVEVVGDPARQLPDGLHLLRVAQLLLAPAERLLAPRAGP